MKDGSFHNELLQRVGVLERVIAPERIGRRQNHTAKTVKVIPPIARQGKLVIKPIAKQRRKPKVSCDDASSSSTNSSKADSIPEKARSPRPGGSAVRHDDPSNEETRERSKSYL